LLRAAQNVRQDGEGEFEAGFLLLVFSGQKGCYLVVETRH
jgi:hypothetical protein